MFIAYIDDGNQDNLPNINGNNDVMVLIKPIRKPDYDQHFDIDNDEFNNRFNEEMECVWSSNMDLADTITFLKSIGMVENLKMYY